MSNLYWAGNFEDFCMLNLIGTFVLRCKLAKSARNGLEDRKKALYGHFRDPPPPPIGGHRNFRFTLKVAQI